MEWDSNVLAQIYARICAEPDVDAHREAYRDALPIEDPHRRFIELQLLRAKKRRETMDRLDTPSHEECDFLYRLGCGDDLPNRLMWHDNIVSHALRGQRRLDRGFVCRIECDAKHFLEARDQIFAAAPLQGIILVNQTNSPVPLSEILCCPELTRLESLALMGWKLSVSAIKAIANCENIRALHYLELAHPIEDPAVFEVLAGSPITRGIYEIDFSVTGHHSCPYPIRRKREHETEFCWYTELPILFLPPMPPAGRELEARFGYIPWLHEYESHYLDHAYHLKMGTLPRRPVGSPVDYENDPEDGKPKQI